MGKGLRFHQRRLAAIQNHRVKSQGEELNDVTN